MAAFRISSRVLRLAEMSCLFDFRSLDVETSSAASSSSSSSGVWMEKVFEDID